MTNKEILTKAIEKAVENGWDWFPYGYGKGKTLWDRVIADDESFQVIVDDDPIPFELYCFDHQFAKAFWGEGVTDVGRKFTKDGVGVYEAPEWLFRIQQLAIAEDRLEYIGRFL